MIDNQDGTYSLMYSLSSEGDHTLHPQVDGTPLRRRGFPVMATFGSLQAQDVVASLQDQDVGHVCGGVCSVHVKVACLHIASLVLNVAHHKSPKSVKSFSTSQDLLLLFWV